MEDLKTLFAYFKEHKKGVIVILIATVIGAALGAAAFYITAGLTENDRRKIQEIF
jgi:hypothetical protein